MNLNPTDSTQVESEEVIREKLFLSLNDDDIEVRLTKLEELLKEFKNSDSEKEAV